LKDDPLIAQIIAAQQAKRAIRLDSVSTTQSAYDESIKPTFYSGYDQRTGTSLATTLSNGDNIRTIVITSTSIAPGDKVSLRPSSGLDRIDNISVQRRNSIVAPKPKPSIKWELLAGATYNDVDGVYTLTVPGGSELGGISSIKKVTKRTFRFTFEFRIYGSTTLVPADGLALSYLPSDIFIPGNDLGVGDIGDGFSCGVDTYFGRPNDPLEVRVFIRYGSNTFYSESNLNLRSVSWQQAIVVVTESEITVTFGTTTLSIPITPLPAKYYLRFSAATALFNDFHEVRNPLLNGKPLNFPD
jgi:hypothetical protein